ncbi:hypothetical protein KDL44_04665 [bacterium]|nr:hypothetical protein [bacterium]
MKLPKPRSYWDDPALKGSEIVNFDPSLDLSHHAVYLKALLDERKLPWLDQVFAFRAPGSLKWEILFESKCEFDPDRRIVVVSDSEHMFPIMISSMWGHLHTTPCEVVEWVMSMRTEDLVEVAYFRANEYAGGSYELARSLNEHELQRAAREVLLSQGEHKAGSSITIAVYSWLGTHDALLHVNI